MSFTIMTDTSANLPEEFLRENKIKCIAYTFMIDGKEPADFHFEGKAFYDDMRRGKIVTTSQISPQRYADFFREELAALSDVGHRILGGLLYVGDTVPYRVEAFFRQFHGVEAFGHSGPLV